MCLGFNWAGAQAVATLFAARAAAMEAEQEIKKHNVSCNDTQHTIIRHKSDKNGCGSTSVLCRMAAVGDQVMLMYPVPVHCIGEKAEHLVEAAEVACQSSSLKAFTNPKAYVKKPTVEVVPMYRSLGGDNAGAPRGQPEVPVVPEVACKQNMDGSLTFVLGTGDRVLTDEQVGKAIEKGTYKDKADYYDKMGKGCLTALTSMLRKQGVDLSCIFEMEGDEVSGFGRINFLDQLLPNLRPGCHMMVAVPPFDADKKPMMDGAFSFVFHYKGSRRELPILGLVHNADDSVEEEQPVEDNFYLMGNGSFPVSLVNSDTRSNNLDIELLGASAFLPTAPAEEFDVDDRNYRSMRYFRGDEELQDQIDYSAWRKACSILQDRAREKLMESMSDVVKKMGLPDFDDSALFVQNLVGLHVPHYTTTMLVGRDPRLATAASFETRVAAKRSRDEETSKVGRKAQKSQAVAIKMDVEPAVGIPTPLLAGVPQSHWTLAVTFAEGLSPEYIDEGAFGQPVIHAIRFTPAHAEQFGRFVALLPHE